MMNDFKNYLLVIFIFSSFNISAMECMTCEKEKTLYEYANDLIAYYNRTTCSESLIPFELKTPLSHEQRCQIIDDLSLLKSISLSEYGEQFMRIFTPSKFPDKAGEEIYQWLINRIKGIYFIDSNVSTAINYGLCEETDVCHSSYVRGDIGLDDSYFSKSTPLERLMVLIHEARHTDGHDYLTQEITTDVGYDTLHVSCNQASYSMDGSSTVNSDKICDENVNGSIGATMTFLGNLILYSNNYDSLVNFGDPELNMYYVKNLYNNELSSIKEIDFDISRPLN